jgi:hypothetical protein
MYGKLQITAILSRPYRSLKIRFKIVIYIIIIIMSSFQKKLCQPLTALAGVSAPFARYCLKMIRPMMILPMLQMTEQYTTICAPDLEPSALFESTLPIVKKPILVLSRTVA